MNEGFGGGWDGVREFFWGGKWLYRRVLEGMGVEEGLWRRWLRKRLRCGCGRVCGLREVEGGGGQCVW